MGLDDFFARYLELEPEEATTLGSDVGIDRLRDGSEAGLERRAAFFREALAALDATDDGDLDREAFVRLARYELHLYESPWRWSNPEWALYPYTMLRLQRASGAGAIDARAAQIPAYLAADAERLRAGRDQGHVAHRSLLGYLGEHALPAAARWFEDDHPEAAAAYRAHAGLYAELGADAPPDGSLGPEEYERRWTLSFALDESPTELAARARDELASLREAILETARSLAGDAHLRDFADAAALVRELQSERFAEGEDVRARYRAILERACAFARERGLFHVDGALAELGMDAYPEGMRDMGAGTNWPAPLLRPGGRGQFVIHPDPAAHPAAWAPVLAIHEGLPGHFLQSWHWQRRFGGGEARAPFRFACVADDVAIPRQYFGAMLNVEGYAVYAEERMRAAGFHEGRDALFALVGHAIRAARVVGDVELNRRTMTADETAAFVAENVGLPEGAARLEAERYQRGPLQAVTYFAGADAIADIAERARDRGLEDAAFHDWFFGFGPAQPARIAAALEGVSGSAC